MLVAFFAYRCTFIYLYPGYLAKYILNHGIVTFERSMLLQMKVENRYEENVLKINN